MFVCPSLCYTAEYQSDQQEYPLYGNESYSGVSLLIKFIQNSVVVLKEFVDM
jgi:hypothetical protein